jgi:cephalosporin hydroxylase
MTWAGLNAIRDRAPLDVAEQILRIESLRGDCVTAVESPGQANVSSLRAMLTVCKHLAPLYVAGDHLTVLDEASEAIGVLPDALGDYHSESLWALHRLFVGLLEVCPRKTFRAAESAAFKSSKAST